MSGQRSSFARLFGRNRHHCGHRTTRRVDIHSIIVRHTIPIPMIQLVRWHIIKAGIFEGAPTVARGIHIFHADSRAELTVGRANRGGPDV